MAVSHPKLVPPFAAAPLHVPRHPVPSVLPSRPAASSLHLTFTLRPRPRRTSATTDRGDSLSTLVTQLQQQEEEEQDENQEESTSVTPRPEEQLPARWREIHGHDNWAGLLDPIDPLLRSELIRYGEFSQACYDAFDYDRFSRYCGSCKYPRRTFFTDLGMGDCGYEVTRYLYATANIGLPKFFTSSRRGANTWSERADWIGFIAVSSDAAKQRLGRRDIVVAWRGTVTRLEWVADLMDYLRPVMSVGIPCPDPGVKVESGFLDLYTDKDPACRFCKYSAREQVVSEVRKWVEQFAGKGEEVSVTVTGHSLGAALAVLSAYDVAETGAAAGAAAVGVVSFAGPRVGNPRFRRRVEELGVRALRVVNVHDAVPKVPGMILNERVEVPEAVRRVAEEVVPWMYSHVGVELALDHKSSPFLKQTNDPSCFHNMEAHLHLLDGYHGKGKRFVLASGRDPALVNKDCDFLKDHHMVPPRWRQDQNKGMVRSSDGRWVQPDRGHHKLDDVHPSDTLYHLGLLGLASDTNSDAGATAISSPKVRPPQLPSNGPPGAS